MSSSGDDSSESSSFSERGRLSCHPDLNIPATRDGLLRPQSYPRQTPRPKSPVYLSQVET